MAIRQIVLEGDDVLRKKCRPVTDFNQRLWTMLDDMAETMYASDGAGLAAPQIGVLRQAVVIDTGDGLIELINPQIIEEKGKQEGPEGCLSCPGEAGIVVRPMHVKVAAQNRYGEKIVLKGSELTARAMCHESDHLNGRLFKDIAVRMMQED